MTIVMMPDISGQFTILRDLPVGDTREVVLGGVRYLKDNPFNVEELNSLIAAVIDDTIKLPKLSYRGHGLQFREEGNVVSLCHRKGDHISEPFVNIDMIGGVNTEQIIRMLDQIDVNLPKKSRKPSPQKKKDR